MARGWDPKDPDEVLDYELDWSTRLATGDTITASSWSIATGDEELVIGETSFTDSTTTLWLSGGTLSTTYKVLNRVTTAQGRVHDKTTYLRIREK